MPRRWTRSGQASSSHMIWFISFFKFKIRVVYDAHLLSMIAAGLHKSVSANRACRIADDGGVILI